MAKIQNSGNYIRQQMYGKAPYDTGNLKNNGISPLKSVGDIQVEFEIGGQNAPYGILLNNQSKIRGRANKHFGWIDKSFDEAVDGLAKMLGGVVEG